MAVWIVVELVLETPELSVRRRLRAWSDENELRTVPQRIKQRIADEMNPLLAVEPANVGDDRLVAVAQPQALPQRPLVVVFEVERVEAIATRDERVDFGIPCVVVDTVENTAEVPAMGPDGITEAEILIGMDRFPSVTRRNGSDKVRLF